MTAFKEGSQPPRRGTYDVRLADGSETVAVYAEQDGAKTWLCFPAGRPDAERKTPVKLAGVAGYRPATKESLAALTAAQTTEAERIEAAYEFYLSHRSRQLYTVDIPPRRQLAVGDAVELGALEDEHVVALRRDGQDVVVSHRKRGRRHGVDFDHGIAYLAVHWSEVVPAGRRKDTHLARRPLLLDAYRTFMLDTLMHKVRSGVSANPDYRRGYVWSEQDKRLYLESIFEGRELGRFIFVRNKYPLQDEILDGKQRLACITDFVEGRIPYKGVYYDELSVSDRGRFDSRSVQFAELSAEEMSRATLLEIFLQVNAAGVPQSQEHLAHVRRLLGDELRSGARTAEAVAMLERYPSHETVADLYDAEEDLRSALATVFPGFEYPDFSHLEMRDVVAKARRESSRSASDKR